MAGESRAESHQGKKTGNVVLPSDISVGQPRFLQFKQTKHQGDCGEEFKYRLTPDEVPVSPSTSIADLTRFETMPSALAWSSTSFPLEWFGVSRMDVRVRIELMRCSA